MKTIDLKRLESSTKVMVCFKDLYPNVKYPFSANLGYEETDLVLIEAKSELQGISLERNFIHARCMAELKSDGEDYEILNISKENQRLLELEGGKKVDCCLYQVIVISRKILNTLKHEFLKESLLNKSVQHQNFLEKVEAESLCYETTVYFDITKFFGKLF